VVVGGRITNEEVSHGFLGTEFVAKDEHGHSGYGRTAEEAQYALEKAQKYDLQSCTQKTFFVSGDPISRESDDVEGGTDEKSDDARSSDDDDSADEVNEEIAATVMKALADEYPEMFEDEDEDSVGDQDEDPVNDEHAEPAEEEEAPQEGNAYQSAHDEMVEPEVSRLEEKLFQRRMSVTGEEIMRLPIEIFRRPDSISHLRYIPRHREFYLQTMREIAKLRGEEFDETD
jgi:hypothetical protein